MHKFLKIILYAILLTPLLLWSIFLFPFITTKVLYFRLLVEAALVVYLPLALKNPELRPKWNWLTVSVWLYLAVVFLTSLLGVNFGKSFWGTVERGEGIITLLHFAVYFTILPTVFRTHRDFRRYFTMALLVITFIALIGFVQLVCTDQYTGAVSRTGFCSLAPPTQGARISATIGNAAFFAAFLLFGVVLAILLGSQSQHPRQRLLFYLMALFNAFILLETQTRGGAIALYVIVFILLWYYVFLGRRFVLRLAATALALAMILAPVLIFTKPELLPTPIREIAVVRRLSTISKTDITTQSRLDTWQASFRGWQDRFFLGYGYENYNVAFNKYFPARIFKDQGSQVWFDRAHNIIFDVAVTSGIIGLLAYLGIFLAAAAILFRLWRRGQESALTVLILGSLLLGYFLQNLFVFDTHATYLMFFAVLGYIVFLATPSPLSPPTRGGELKDKEFPPTGGEGKGGGFFTKSIMAVLMFMIAYFVNFEPAVANVKATNAIKAAKLQQYREVSEIFESSLSFGTYMDEEIRQRLVDYAHEAAASGLLSPQEQAAFYRYVIAELEKSIATSPRDVKNYLYLMNVFNRTASDEATINQIILRGQQAVALSPTRPHIYFELGQAYFLKKDFASGLEQFKTAVELNPEPKESHLNYLLASIIAGREDIADHQQQALLDLGYQLTTGDYLGLGRAYLQAGKVAKAIENYARAAEASPTNPDVRAKLAAAYGEACDLENAEREVNKTIELEPSFVREGKAFLNQLVEKCQK